MNIIVLVLSFSYRLLLELVFMELSSSTDFRRFVVTSLFSSSSASVQKCRLFVHEYSFLFLCYYFWSLKKRVVSSGIFPKPSGNDFGIFSNRVDEFGGFPKPRGKDFGTFKTEWERFWVLSKSEWERYLVVRAKPEIPLYLRFENGANPISHPLFGRALVFKYAIFLKHLCLMIF